MTNLRINFSTKLSLFTFTTIGMGVIMSALIFSSNGAPVLGLSHTQPGTVVSAYCLSCFHPVREPRQIWSSKVISATNRSGPRLCGVARILIFALTGVVVRAASSARWCLTDPQVIKQKSSPKSVIATVTQSGTSG